MAVKEKKKKQFDIQSSVLSLANAVKKPEVNKNTNNKTTATAKPTQSNNNKLTINNRNQTTNQTTVSPKRETKTIKTPVAQRKGSIATFDLYEKNGRYYYKDEGKEHEVDRKYLQNAINNNRSGVIGRFDENGNWTETNKRGVAKATKKKEETVVNNTPNKDGYIKTNKKYGDYDYHNYNELKDYDIYKKFDEKTKRSKAYYYDPKTKTYVDMDQPRLTSEEIDKREREEAIKQGFKGNNIYKVNEKSKLIPEQRESFNRNTIPNQNEMLKKQVVTNKEIEQISPTTFGEQVDIDTSGLTKKEREKYVKSLLRQEKARDDELSYVRKAGAVGELKNMARNINKNAVEPISRAPSSYEYGDLQKDLSMAYADMLKGKKVDVEELQRKLNNYYRFNQDVMNSNNELDTYFKNLPNQISGIEAGVKNAGVLGGIGAIGGGIIGAVTAKNPATTLAFAERGARLLGGAGYVKGQAQNTYDLEAGATYQTLLEMGVPDDIARKEAKRVGTENALIESGESILDLLTFGKASAATSKLTEGLIKKYGLDTLKSWGMSYATNIASEGLQEGLQEQRSIAGEQRAANQAGIERDSSQDLNRILSSAKSGAFNAAITGAGTRVAGMTGSSIYNTGKSQINTKIEEANQQIQQLNNIADQRIQQLKQEVQQDPTKAQEAVQEIEDIQRYVQAQTNIIQNQAQTQAQESETTQPNAITQESQNMLDKAKEIDIKEPEYEGKLGPIAQKVDDTLQKIQGKTNGDEYIGIVKQPSINEQVNSQIKQRKEYLNDTLNKLSQNDTKSTKSEYKNLNKTMSKIQEKRDNDEELSEKEFYKLYSAHKLLGKNDVDSQETIKSIKQNGFNSGGAFGTNVVPSQIIYNEDGSPKTWTDNEYAPKKGEYVMFVPEGFIDTSNDRYRVEQGFKPSEVEIVKVERDNQPYYELYKKNFEQLKSQTQETSNQKENIPATKSENVISEEIAPQQKTTETTQQEERKQPEILDKMPTEKKSTIKSLKKGIDTFRKEITDRFAAVYDMAQKTRNKTLYHKADRILSSDGMAQVDIESNQVNLNGKPYTNFTDENGNKTSMSWVQAFDLYNKIPNKDKNTFLVNQLNMDRLNQGVNQFDIPYDESVREVARLREQYPDIDKWSENIYQYYRNLQDKMVENGRASQELVDKWRKETPHYVHIQRDVQNKGNTGVSVKNGKIDSDNLIRKVKGSDLAILPIKDTTAKFTQNATRAFTYNDFGKEYAKTIGYDSQGNNATDVDLDEMFGLDPEFVNKDSNGNYTMKLYENGGVVEVPISEDVYKSLSPQNIPRAGVLAEATTLYKDLLTNKNPFFGFLRNPIKDAQDMFLYSKHPLYKSLATYGKLFGGRTLLKNKVDGVKAKDIVDFYHNTGNVVHSIYKNGQFDTNNKIKEASDKVLSPIEKGNDFMESMPRITEFWNTIQSEGYTLKDGELVPKKGKNPKKSVEQVIAEASYNAADVTVNFKRGGRTSKVISQNGGIFFNPSVQGASKFVRNITEAVSDAKSGDFRAAKLLVARAAMLGVAPAIIGQMMYGDDDEYKDIQDYQKDQYYIIKGENGKWIRIPKGRAISLFQSATRRSIEKSQGRKDAFKGYGQLIGNQIAPNNPLDNNIFSPVFQAAANKSWSKNKIVSDSMAKRPVEEQFNEKTDEFSKWIGKKLHISPMKVNYVIDQYSGVLGDLALPQITPKATTGSSNPIMNILRDNYSFNAANSSKSLNDFYEMKSKIQTKARGINATDKDKIQSKYLGTQSQEMYSLYTEKQKIQMDNSLSKKEKYDQALEVQKKINKKAKDAIKGSKDIDINKNYATVGDNTYYKDSGDWKKESEKTTQRREELGLSADKYYYYRNEEAYKKPDGKYKYITSGENAKRNIAIVDAFDFDTSDYLEYTYKLSQIKSDKNSSGKTIRNSRKPKVIKYIQSLPISKAQKEYLYKTQYSSYRSGDSTLAKQIKNSNLTQAEKNEIYSYLNLGR